MRRRGDTKNCTETRRVVAFFTAREVQAALYKCYPERYKSVPDGAHMWFSFVDGEGMKVEVID